MVQKCFIYRRLTDNNKFFKVDVNSGVQTQLTHIGGPVHQANIGGDWFDPAYALPVSPQPELLTTTWGRTEKGIRVLGLLGIGSTE